MAGNSQEKPFPKHIGIIMDGNGRWAKKRGLPRLAGHREGAKTLSKTARHCRDIGVRYVTFYTWSTENWKRPREELDGVMNLLREYLKDAENNSRENVRTLFIGDRTPLAPDIRERIALVEEKSAANEAITVNIALNYGGRDEIVKAARELAAMAARGALPPSEITEETLAGRLYTAGQPDPDMIIRPSGEYRLSNFMLWQSAYAELIFMDILWPDFKPADLDWAIAEFQGRDRRFGGL